MLPSRAQIKNRSNLADLGIDSLMAMELAREIQTALKCNIQAEQFFDLTDVQSLVDRVQTTLGVGSGAATASSDETPEEKSSADETTHTNDDSRQVNGYSTQDDENSSQLNGDLPAVNGDSRQVNGISHSVEKESSLSEMAILEAFKETKEATDWFISEYGMGDFNDRVLPRSTELCVAYIIEAFEEMGCSLRDVEPGQKLERIEYLPRHEKLVEFLYELLEKHARLIDVAGNEITRTSTTLPKNSASALLDELIHDFPDHAFDHKLTSLTGVKLADCLTGKSDGIQLIFGNSESREIVSKSYSTSPLNLVWIKQAEDFLKRLFAKLPKLDGPINILEMGAGTGGTTAMILALLESLNIPVQYTVTDLSPSLVASARKRFQKYPFVNCRVLDIEKRPAEELLYTQHIVLATNCVPATHNLERSTKNIHNVLRPDGVLVLLELTEPPPWIDFVFGLLEGWWLFDDGRQHATAQPSVWEKTLQSVGYGHVDWTEGQRPEATVQRVIIALASGPRYDRVPKLPKTVQTQSTDIVARQAVVDGYIQKFTLDFTPPIASDGPHGPDQAHVVLVTGATGSLGSHLVAHFSKLSTVTGVICLNRHSRSEPEQRQRQAFDSRNILLDSSTLSKLRVVETDASKAMLGLPKEQYESLSSDVTHIVHNAWPMGLTRPIKSFEAQFKVMRNLVELARDTSCKRPSGSKIGFQFISSIATVGHYQLWSGNVRVPEEKMMVDSVLPSGYGDAKLVCERMLDETLHKYPDRFSRMVVRIGQIAGSNNSGLWNTAEHFAFMIKSSQTLKTLPDLQGNLSWCPVDDVAASLGELLITDNTPYPIYHIENPTRQPWHETIRVLADEMGILHTNIIPFSDWIRRVREYPGSPETDNPAVKLIGFLEEHFHRMSCGGLILDTARAANTPRRLE